MACGAWELCRQSAHRGAAHLLPGKKTWSMARKRLDVVSFNGGEEGTKEGDKNFVTPKILNIMYILLLLNWKL